MKTLAGDQTVVQNSDGLLWSVDTFGSGKVRPFVATCNRLIVKMLKEFEFVKLGCWIIGGDVCCYKNLTIIKG